MEGYPYGKVSPLSIKQVMSILSRKRYYSLPDPAQVLIFIQDPRDRVKMDEESAGDESGSRSRVLGSIGDSAKMLTRDHFSSSSSSVGGARGQNGANSARSGLSLGDSVNFSYMQKSEFFGSKMSNGSNQGSKNTPGHSSRYLKPGFYDENLKNGKNCYNEKRRRKSHLEPSQGGKELHEGSSWYNGSPSGSKNKNIGNKSKNSKNSSPRKIDPSAQNQIINLQHHALKKAKNADSRRHSLNLRFSPQKSRKYKTTQNPQKSSFFGNSGAIRGFDQEQEDDRSDVISVRSFKSEKRRSKGYKVKNKKIGNPSIFKKQKSKMDKEKDDWKKMEEILGVSKLVMGSSDSKLSDSEKSNNSRNLDNFSPENAKNEIDEMDVDGKDLDPFEKFQLKSKMDSLYRRQNTGGVLSSKLLKQRKEETPKLEPPEPPQVPVNQINQVGNRSKSFKRKKIILNRKKQRGLSRPINRASGAQPDDMGSPGSPKKAGYHSPFRITTKKSKKSKISKMQNLTKNESSTFDFRVNRSKSTQPAPKKIPEPSEQPKRSKNLKKFTESTQVAAKLAGVAVITSVRNSLKGNHAMASGHKNRGFMHKKGPENGKKRKKSFLLNTRKNRSMSNSKRRRVSREPREPVNSSFVAQKHDLTESESSMLQADLAEKIEKMGNKASRNKLLSDSYQQKGSGTNNGLTESFFFQKSRKNRKRTKRPKNKFKGVSEGFPSLSQTNSPQIKPQMLNLGSPNHLNSQIGRNRLNNPSNCFTPKSRPKEVLGDGSSLFKPRRSLNPGQSGPKMPDMYKTILALNRQKMTKIDKGLSQSFNNRELERSFMRKSNIQYEKDGKVTNHFKPINLLEEGPGFSSGGGNGFGFY